MENRSKSDIHVHSKYSDRPAEWLLRRVGAPECFMEPREVYRRAKEHGMDYVTIADHNCINGALEIADHKDVFISCEITTYFPEDGCKIHVLASGISESQFLMIEELRANIYELHDYLIDEGIIATVNHPFYAVNDRLTIEHIEKLLLMFKRFEVVNGIRDQRPALLLKAVLNGLTREMVEEMANRHRIAPCGDEPWRKFRTGGSDDHSGAHIARAYTSTPKAENVQEYLSYLKEGRHFADGSSGGSLIMAHSLIHIVCHYYKAKFLSRQGKTGFLGSMLEQLLAASADKPSRFGGIIPGFAKRFVLKRKMRKLNDVEKILIHEVVGAAQNREVNGIFHSSSDAGQAFKTTSRMTHLLAYNMLCNFASQIREGRICDAFQSIASLGFAALGAAPYLTAFSTQHRDSEFLDALASRFRVSSHASERKKDCAVFADALDDNLESIAWLLDLIPAAKKENTTIAALTCMDKPPENEPHLTNFTPVGKFRISEYHNRNLFFPPFLEVMEHTERRRYHELIIATPGPMGLTGLAAGGLLGLRKTGLYCTDLLATVRQSTQDQAMEELAGKYLLWFYSQMNKVLVPNEYFHRQLISIGLEASRIKIFNPLNHTMNLNQNRASSDWDGIIKPLMHYLYSESSSENRFDTRLTNNQPGLIVMDVA